MYTLGDKLCPHFGVSWLRLMGNQLDAQVGWAIRRTYILTFNVFYFALGRCYIVTLSRCHVFDFRYLPDDEGVRCQPCYILTFNI